MNESYLVEDDVIHTGENPNEYRNRLLRNIKSGDISSFDHHDKVHGALAYIESIRDQYTGSARNINLVVRGRGDKHGTIGYKVHGISPSGKHIIATPAAVGGGHGKPEERPIREIMGLQVSSYPNLKPEHRKVLERLMDLRGLKEMYENVKQLFLERRTKKKDCGCDHLQEAKKEKKPYKGFKKGKNHPEGGLSRKEAHRQGIHAGIETKDEAKRKGGFNKLSKKTQSRRKSFCARMCGMKKRRTSSKTAHDPKSKINAALRVWGCRCGTNESHETETPMINEAKSLKSACWKGYEAIGTKMKNGRKVPNCVPVNERVMLVKAKLQEAKELIKEEVVNAKHKGTMTPKERKERDRIAKGLKGIKSIKGKPDSEKEAKFRYATYLVLRKRGGGKSEKTSKSEKPSKSTKKKKKSK